MRNTVNIKYIAAAETLKSTHSVVLGKTVNTKSWSKSVTIIVGER
jgi:hypothetical protein